jgi:hypothetical protein
VRSEDPAGIGESIRDLSDLWAAVFFRRNLMIALKRVERNRGAAGADGLRTEELRSWCLGHWTETREALVQRAQVLLMAAEGLANESIAKVGGTSPGTVRPWRARFEVEGLAHLGEVRAGRGRKPVIPPSRK